MTNLLFFFSGLCVGAGIRFVRHQLQTERLKTIDDIKPPRVIYAGMDWAKMKPVTYASNNHADILKGKLQ